MLPEDKSTDRQVERLYFALDGDDVGHRLEYYALTNDTRSLGDFAAKFRTAMDWLEGTLVENYAGSILFSGGDSLMASIELRSPVAETLEPIREEFWCRAGATFSGGLGRTPREAYFALKFAKAGGKNCVRFYDELSHG